MYGNFVYAEARCQKCGCYIKDLTVETYRDVSGGLRHVVCHQRVRLQPHPADVHNYWLRKKKQK
jgi:hypothetical protein